MGVVLCGSFIRVCNWYLLASIYFSNLLLTHNLEDCLFCLLSHDKRPTAGGGHTPQREGGNCLTSNVLVVSYYWYLIGSRVSYNIIVPANF